MKLLFLILLCSTFACFMPAGFQPACAADAEQVRKIEEEIKILQQATSDQGKKIQSLEQRVSAQRQEIPAPEQAPPAAEKYIDDGQVKPLAGPPPGTTVSPQEEDPSRLPKAK